MFWSAVAERAAASGDTALGRRFHKLAVLVRRNNCAATRIAEKASISYSAGCYLQFVRQKFVLQQRDCDTADLEACAK
jgi:hypothetical protein